MDLKKKLQKLDLDDLKWICKELNIKCYKYTNKNNIIKLLLKPIIKKKYKFDKDILKEDPIFWGSLEKNKHYYYQGGNDRWAFSGTFVDYSTENEIVNGIETGRVVDIVIFKNYKEYRVNRGIITNEYKTIGVRSGGERTEYLEDIVGFWEDNTHQTEPTGAGS